MQLLEVFGVLKVNQVPNACLDQNVPPVHSAGMRRGQRHKDIHFILELLQMFHGLPDQNAAQRVPYEADSFVGIV
jgi:hypothetical protein